MKSVCSSTPWTNVPTRAPPGIAASGSSTARSADSAADPDACRPAAPPAFLVRDPGVLGLAGRRPPPWPPASARCTTPPPRSCRAPVERAARRASRRRVRAGVQRRRLRPSPLDRDRAGRHRGELARPASTTCCSLGGRRQRGAVGGEQQPGERRLAAVTSSPSARPPGGGPGSARRRRGAAPRPAPRRRARPCGREVGPCVATDVDRAPVAVRRVVEDGRIAARRSTACHRNGQYTIGNSRPLQRWIGEDLHGLGVRVEPPAAVLVGDVLSRPRRSGAAARPSGR